MGHNPNDFPMHILPGCPEKIEYVETTSWIYDSTNPFVPIGYEIILVERILNAGAKPLNYEEDNVVITENTRGIKDPDEYDYFNDQETNPPSKHISNVHLTCHWYLCQKYWTLDYSSYMSCPITECPDCQHRYITAEWVKYEYVPKKLDLLPYRQKHPNEYDHFIDNEWPRDNDLRRYKQENPDVNLDLYAYNTSYNYVYRAIYFSRTQYKRTVY